VLGKRDGQLGPGLELLPELEERAEAERPEGAKEGR
jgi:hypothetical protein